MAVVAAVSLLAVTLILLSHFRIVRQHEEAFEKEHDQRIKITEFYDILIRWIALYQENETIAGWMAERGYKRIAVYGMGELGELIYRELVRENLDVRCAIDKNADNLNLKKIKALKPMDDLPELDVVIVSLPRYFEQIRSDLGHITRADIVSIEDIIFEM